MVLEEEEGIMCRGGIMPSGVKWVPQWSGSCKRCLGNAGPPFPANGLLSIAFDPGRKYWQDGLQEGDSSLPA